MKSGETKKAPFNSVSEFKDFDYIGKTTFTDEGKERINII